MSLHTGVQKSESSSPNFGQGLPRLLMALRSVLATQIESSGHPSLVGFAHFVSPSLHSLGHTPGHFLPSLSDSSSSQVSSLVHSLALLGAAQNICVALSQLTILFPSHSTFDGV